MKKSRREFIKTAALGTTGISLASSALGMSAKSYRAVHGANDRIHMAVIGIRGRGFAHLKNWADMSKSENVYVKTMCDADERLFPERLAAVEKIQGVKPGTEYDMRRVYDDKEIDAVSIATPNHWHALATIWAVQAGKHVYSEKPAMHNVWEGRKMIEAARKYDRLVEVGFQNRSIESVRKAMKFLHDGGIGKIYMAKGMCYKPRDSFGMVPDSTPPPGLHYDLWTGPARMLPYNEKHLHYNWHWFWNTGNGDIGNQGPHQFDIARWGMNKSVHPVTVHSIGGYYKWTDCDQQTANTQTAQYEYADGTILQFEVRGLYTNGEADLDVKVGNLFFGTEGWMEINGSTWKTYFGRKNEPGPSSESQEKAVLDYKKAPGGGGHFNNFIQALKSGKRSDLTCDIWEGYMSSVLPLLANISYRLDRKLQFNGDWEKFVNDPEANMMLTRRYRPPYIVPENV